MAFTQADIDKARAEGIKAAIDAVEKELKKAQKEVDLAEKPTGKFAAGNQDRAVLRRDVINKMIRDLRKVK